MNNKFLSGNDADELLRTLQNDGYQIIISTSQTGVAVRLQKPGEKAFCENADDWKVALGRTVAKLPRA